MFGSHAIFHEGFGCVLRHGAKQPYIPKSDIDALRIPKSPPLLAEIKYFGRYKGGAIRDGVIMAIGDINAAPVMGTWSCDSDEAVAAFDLRS